MLKNYRGLAIGLAALVASVGLAIAAGNYETLPIYGQPATCISTVSGAGGYNPQGNVGGGGVSGQGQASSGSLCAQTLPAGPPLLTGSEIVPVDTGLQIPATATVPVSLLGNFSGTPRNYIDNGSLNVQQRGTGTVTCGTTTVPPATAYGPDRWGCFANVASGAGRTAIVTTASLLPTGFASVNTVWRNSGALTQPVCAVQEIPTAKFTALQGKTVSLSAYAAALAGLSADNGNLITASIVTGTGADQGLQSLTASPAITPAWTGVASPLNQQVTTITTTPTRYALGTAIIPATATEGAVLLCFTPTATGSGTTDGFAYTGVQLEVAPSPSPYEFHDIVYDTVVAERYLQILTEPAAGAQVPVIGNSTSATAAAMAYSFPVTMRTAPTFNALGNALSATTWTNKCGNVNNVLATTFIVTATANTPSGASLTVTSTGSTIGFGCVLVGAGGGSILSWTADF